jgi:hypothetical protein
MREVQNRMIVVKAGLGKNQDSISKLIRAKRAKGVDQAAEHLPSKHDALS